MIRLFSHKKRPVHLGPYPLERLPRAGASAVMPESCSQTSLDAEHDDPRSLANSMQQYVDVLDRMREGDVAPHEAPIPADTIERANHLKAACYFLDASMAATGRIPARAILAEPVVNQRLAAAAEKEYGAGSADNPMAGISVREGRAAWGRAMTSRQEPLGHSHALVILVEHTRDPDPTEPGGAWLAGTQPQRAALRAAEVAAVMANYLRMLGYPARMHTVTASELDLDRMILATGLGVVTGRNGNPRVEVPYLGQGYGVAVVSTGLKIAADLPLAPHACRVGRDFRWWLGLGGTRPGIRGRPFAKRHFHLGPYPMESVRRVARPTTLIDEDKVPRVPKRHDMFIRAAIGDLGPKAKKELDDFRMITKSPFGHAMIPVLGGMVPLQYGNESQARHPDCTDPGQNARAVKAALYYLGADMVGICEVPKYAWYSHDTDGSEIEPYHKYAISILVDQGYETMEGASGDDWISGAQSMRAYMRAQLIGGVVGEHIRRMGYSARGHSVMDQDVLHIPLILESGLGELSRIGELVLNPFVGPRFKSGIITTDLPLEPDLPIDFGLQDFCGKCLKCARECPCTAIPFGEKIVFNGYEMWKPDVEKCSRYRIVNQAGSMCGRCMKTCPFNLEGVMKERPFLWMAMHWPATRKWLADLDDKVGNGRINPLKKWWWDLDTDEDGRVVPAGRVNERELLFRDPLTAAQQKLGCYPAETAPDPRAGPTPPDRKAGMEAYRNAPSPVEYRRRRGLS